MFIDISKFNLENLDKKNQEFYSIPDFDTKLEVWKELDEFFSIGDYQKIKEYWHSYFRWYTDLTWKNFNTFDSNAVINKFVNNQVVMAMTLDFDVYKKIISYLYLRTVDENEMRGVYNDMKNSFVNSEFYFLDYKTKEKVTIKSLVELVVKKSVRDDSLEKAEFNSYLESLFFPEIEKEFYEKYIYIDKSQVVNDFVNLVNFFLGVEVEDITYFVKMVSNPEKFEMLKDKKAFNFANPVKNKEDSKIQEEDEIKIITENNETAVEDVKNILDYQQIKKDIENKFAKDDSGQFENLAEVLEYLDELAVKYNDEKIRELYYFDESAGEFGWNQEILK